MTAVKIANSVAMPAKLKLSPAERNRKNLEVALYYAAHGLHVLVADSMTKKPLIYAMNRAEESITRQERAQIVADCEAKGKPAPIQIGATKNPKKIRAMFKRWPGAIPGHAVGADGLVCLDADSKDNGHELLPPLLQKHGALNPNNPAPATWTQSGGFHFYYADPLGLYDNTAGELGDYGADVRGGAGGRGGYVVCQGAIREDGSHYESVVDLPQAFSAGRIPELPPAIETMIRSGSKATKPATAESAAAERSNISATEHTIRQAILSGALPNGIALLDPAFGFDIEALAASSASVAAAVDCAALGDVDHSAARLSVVTALKAAGATACEVAAILMAGEYEICGGYVGHVIRNGKIIERRLDASGGTFDLRNIAREYERAVVRKDRSEVFGAVEDEAEIGPQKAKTKTGLTLLTPDDLDAIKFDPDEYLIPNLMKKGNTGFVFGEPGGGKTAIMIDLACRLSAGIKWHGKTLKRTGVLYVAAENPDDIYGRIKAWRSEARKRGDAVDEMAFAVTPDLIELGEPKSVSAIIKAARELEAKFGVACGLIVVDTFNQSIGSRDENDTRDMTVVTASMKAISVATGATLVGVHHTGKDKGRGMRGSLVLKGNTDFSICLDAKTMKFDAASGSKLRTAAAGTPLKFKLNSVKMGVNSDGEAVTAVVAEPKMERRTDATEAMGAVDEEAAAIPMPDSLQDRVAALVRSVEHRASEVKAEGQAVSDVPVARTDARNLVNAERNGRINSKRDDLQPIDRGTFSRLVKKAIAAGMIGAKGADLYFVPPVSAGRSAGNGISVASRGDAG
jgi:hypothetical protein